MYSGWLYQTKTHFTHIVYQPFSRVSAPSFTLYGYGVLLEMIRATMTNTVVVMLGMIRATMTNTVVVTFSGGHQTPWRHHGFLYKPTFSFSAMQDRPADTQVLV